MRWAVAFLFLYSLNITLAPAARAHSWQVTYAWLHWIGFVTWLVTFIITDKAVRKLVPDRDPYLLPFVAILTGWGLLSIWRLSDTLGARQSGWLLICQVALFLGLRIPGSLNLLRRYRYLWLTGGLILTALTFVFGTYPGGAGPRLWLGCCGMYFQPSEPLKLLLVVYLAAYLADSLLTRFSLVQLLTPTLVLAGVGVVLLVAQRDLGTVTLFFFIYASILYIATGLKRVVALSMILIAAAAAGAYFGFDVVRLRVDAWLNPWADPIGRSYQIVQSLISIASGGILGRGPGLGSPGVVPVAQSDFIFSAIIEETGLLGAVGLLSIIGFLLIRGLRIAANAPEPFQRYLAAGTSVYLAAQSLLIIGGNLRLLPLTGVTLPFVSYGGSSLLTAFIALTLLILISHQPESEPALLPDSRPYLSLGGALLVGLFAAGLLGGWWTIVRSDVLVSRADNPRRVINDRYVRRGALLDRHDYALNLTTGSPGDYSRASTYSPLSPILGYTNGQYGQAGLEASLDAYLRGTQGYPSSTLWINQLLYGQPPPGLDIRLTLDMDLQRAADQALGNNKGSAVLIHATSGEILAMASHPYFDPDKLSEEWNRLIQDPDAPFFDRAAQGQYPAGTAIGPFLAAELIQEGYSLPAPQLLTYSIQGGTIPCNQGVPDHPTIQQALISGCPGFLVELGKTLGASNLLKIYRELGFYQAPNLQLPMESQTAIAGLNDLSLASIGREAVNLSPIQMSLAAATLTSGGIRPSPRLVISVKTPQQGWVVLPVAEDSSQVFTKDAALEVASYLSKSDGSTWGSAGRAPNGPGKSVSWFIGGTQPGWNGTPLSVALAIEEDNTALAISIGEKILSDAMAYR